MTPLCLLLVALAAARAFAYSPGCLRPLQPVHVGRTAIRATRLMQSENPTFDRGEDRRSLPRTLAARWREAVLDVKARPWTYISIPISAGIIGYITNYLGVNMLFYPVNRWGANVLGGGSAESLRQPFGLLWLQGIVPCKRQQMSERIVDVTISKLLTVSEIFQRLEPAKLAPLLKPTVKKTLAARLLPFPLTDMLLRSTVRSVIRDAEKVVDIRDLVVKGLTADPTILGSFFQKVGKAELRFLVDSGFGFGVLLGLLQMVQMMLYPKNWTLPVSGALVGYVTNWIALKWIFEPLNPTRVGPFVLQGLFLRRQPEVSRDFSEYIADNILTSQGVWRSMLEGPRHAHLLDILKSKLLFGSVADSVLGHLRSDVGRGALHPVHAYTAARLDLRNTLVQRMSRLSSAEFEQVLHPVFQEDELTLIIAGGVLGALSGLLQWWFTAYMERRQQRKKGGQ